MNVEEIKQIYKLDVSKRNGILEIDFEILNYEIKVMKLILDETKKNYDEPLSPKLTMEEGSLILRWKVKNIYNQYPLIEKMEGIFGGKVSELYLEVKKLTKELRKFRLSKLKLSDVPNTKLSQKYNDLDVFDILNNGNNINVATTKMAFDIYKKIKSDKSVEVFKNLSNDKSFKGMGTEIFYNDQSLNKSVFITQEEVKEIQSNSSIEDDQNSKLFDTKYNDEVNLISIPRNEKKESITLEFELSGKNKRKTYEYNGKINIDESINNDYAIVDYEIYVDDNNELIDIKILNVHNVFSKIRINERKLTKDFF